MDMPTPDPLDIRSPLLDPWGRRMVRLAACLAVLVAVLLLTAAGWQLYGVLRTENGLTAAANQEWIAAKADHAGIISIAAQCQQAGAAFTHPLVVPAPLTTIVPNGWLGATAANTAPALTLEAPSYLLAAVILSNDIGRSRVDVAGDAVQDNASMQIFEWAMVLVGAVTTVLISIKSIAAGQQNALTAVGIGAIIFSTLGTSIAAVNSFYSPRTTYQHDQHVLSELRNLHLQLAMGIAREGNLCTAWTHWSKDWRFARIKALSDQYAAITGTSQADLPTEGDSSDAPGLPPAPNAVP